MDTPRVVTPKLVYKCPHCLRDLELKPVVRFSSVRNIMEFRCPKHGTLDIRKKGVIKAYKS